MAHDALTDLSIRVATSGDARTLADFAQRTFIDTFGPQNKASDMEMYIARAFGEEIQRGEIEDPRVTVYAEFVAWMLGSSPSMTEEETAGMWRGDRDIAPRLRLAPRPNA